jgi:hypothetical protein
MGMDVDDPGAGVRWSVRFRGIEVSADVDTIRDALLDTSNALVPNTMSEKAHDALAALHRLAAAEAQRDTLAEAHGAILTRCEDANVTWSRLDVAAISRNALAAVAPTEAKP